MVKWQQLLCFTPLRLWGLPILFNLEICFCSPAILLMKLHSLFRWFGTAITGIWRAKVNVMKSERSSHCRSCSLLSQSQVILVPSSRTRNIDYFIYFNFWISIPFKVFVALNTLKLCSNICSYWSLFSKLSTYFSTAVLFYYVQSYVSYRQQDTTFLPVAKLQYNWSIYIVLPWNFFRSKVQQSRVSNLHLVAY